MARNFRELELEAIADPRRRANIERERRSLRQAICAAKIKRSERFNRNPGGAET